MSESEAQVPASNPDPAPWSMLSQGIGVALWTSFMMACVQTMVVFAFLDPATLGFEGLSPTLAALREYVAAISPVPVDGAYWLPPWSSDCRRCPSRGRPSRPLP